MKIVVNSVSKPNGNFFFPKRFGFYGDLIQRTKTDKLGLLECRILATRILHRLDQCLYAIWKLYVFLSLLPQAVEVNHLLFSPGMVCAEIQEYVRLFLFL